MQKRKCHQCGLVNWQGANQCARCNGSLAEAFSTGLSPFENESKSGSGFGAGKIIGLMLLLVVGGFAAYQFTRPEPPKKPTAQELQQVRQSENLQKMILEGQEKDRERMAQMQDDMKKASELPTWNKDLMKQQWKNPQMPR